MYGWERVKWMGEEVRVRQSCRYVGGQNSTYIQRVYGSLVGGGGEGKRILYGRYGFDG